jgi:hypothetical protein
MGDLLDDADGLAPTLRLPEFEHQPTHEENMKTTEGAAPVARSAYLVSDCRMCRFIFVTEPTLPRNATVTILPRCHFVVLEIAIPFSESHQIRSPGPAKINCTVPQNPAHVMSVSSWSLRHTGTSTPGFGARAGVKAKARPRRNQGQGLPAQLFSGAPRPRAGRPG